MVRSIGFSIHFQTIGRCRRGCQHDSRPKLGPSAWRELYTDGVGRAGAGRRAQKCLRQTSGAGLAYALALVLKGRRDREPGFSEEDESDLFGEAAVLCGGRERAESRGFETLGWMPGIATIENGYFEFAYTGMKMMRRSNLCRRPRLLRHIQFGYREYGEYTRGPRIVERTERAR